MIAVMISVAVLIVLRSSSVSIIPIGHQLPVVSSVPLDAATNTDSSVVREPDATYPVPAKKLHGLLSDSGDIFENEALEKRKLILEQQLEMIAKDLSAQGVSVSVSASPVVDEVYSATQIRLKVLQDYIDKKNNSQ